MFIARPLREVAQGILRVSPTRSLSATASFAARPRPRPAPKKPVNNLLTRSPVEEQLPPVALLVAAKKSKALDIEPDVALNILRNYVELSTERAMGKWEKQFCADQSITPRTLILLALILIRCKEQPRRFLGVDLLSSASAIGDPTATLYLVNQGLKSKNLDRSRYIAPLAHLRTLAAPPHSNIEAMVLLGKIYEFQNEEDKALQLYRQAASTSPSSQVQVDTQLPLPGEGVASALVHQGLILERQGNSSDASAAFRQAALEHDDPTAYYHFGRLQTAFSSTQETYFLKAASSGVVEASTSLGQLYLARAMLVPAKNKDQKAKQEKLAKEWLFLAATAGEGQSMLRLADIFIEENKMKSARKWLEMAEKSTDRQVAERAKHLIEQTEESI